MIAVNENGDHNQKVLEFLRDSAEYDKMSVPDFNDDEAFVAYLKLSFKVACAHNLKAIKFLASLLVNNHELARDNHLYHEFAELMKTLRRQHRMHCNKLAEIANNKENKYDVDMQRYACASLKSYADQGDDFARRIFSMVVIPVTEFENYSDDILQTLLKCDKQRNIYTLDLIKQIASLMKQFPEQKENIQTELLGDADMNDVVLLDEKDIKTYMRTSVRTPFALAKLSVALQNYLDSHFIKPEVFLHIGAVLRAVGDTTSDMYGAMIADHIAAKIKTVLEVALKTQVPAFSKTQGQYQSFIDILTVACNEVTHPQHDYVDQYRGEVSLSRSNSFVGNIGARTGSIELVEFKNVNDQSNN